MVLPMTEQELLKVIADEKEFLASGKDPLSVFLRAAVEQAKDPDIKQWFGAFLAHGAEVSSNVLTDAELRLHRLRRERERLEREAARNAEQNRKREEKNRQKASQQLCRLTGTMKEILNDCDESGPDPT